MIASVLAKRAVLRLRSNLPYSGAIQQPGMPAHLDRGIFQRAAPGESQRDDDQQYDPAVMPHEIRNAQHHRGQERQLLFGVGEHRHDLRHHIGQQEDHDQECHHGDDRRVGERELDLLHQRIAPLDVVGKPRQHPRQLADLLAGCDQCAIDVGEVARMARQRIGQRCAAHHFGADRRDQVAHIGAFGLFQQRGERLLQRQAGFEQAGQLAREQCQLDRGQVIAECAAFGQSRLRRAGSRSLRR